MALYYASNDLKNNPMIIRAAMQQNTASLLHASFDMQNNKEFVSMFFNENNNKSKHYDFYQKCLIKMNIWKEEEWLEQNTLINNVDNPLQKF